MRPQTKRILLIIGFAGIVVLMAFLIVTVLFRAPSVSVEPEPEPGTTAGTLPGAQTGRPTVISEPEEGGEGAGQLQPSQVAEGGVTFVTRLTTSQISSPNINGNDLAYYDPADGKFYTIDANGNVVALSAAAFPNAENVLISDNAQVAAIEFPDGSNVLYDFATDSQTTLPSHWEDFDFSPDSKEVVTKSVGIDPGNRALVTTTVDGSQTNVITPLGTSQDYVSVNWSPNNQIVGFSETGTVQSGFGRRQIYLIGQDGEEAGGIIVEGGNFQALWSPNGSNILYSVAYSGNGNRPSLWYTNATGQAGSQRKKFDVETWVNKCTFYDASTVYCAVPRETPKESGIDHGMVTAYDDVYAIDIDSGRTVLIAEPALDIRMTDLFVSADQSVLYFRDQSGRLNSMRLR